MNLRPLGYEHHDARLCCLKQSLIAVLTSASQRHEIFPDLLRLPRLGMFRRVSCTNACTNRPLGLPVRVRQHDRPTWRRHGKHLTRRYLRGRPDPFRTVRDLGRVPPGCPRSSGGLQARSSVWLPGAASAPGTFHLGSGPCTPPFPSHRTDCCRPMCRREGVKCRLACTLTRHFRVCSLPCDQIGP